MSLIYVKKVLNNFLKESSYIGGLNSFYPIQNKKKMINYNNI